MISQKTQDTIGQFITIAIINLALVLVVGVVLFSWLGVAAGADGSVMRDPLFRYNSGTARDNLIVRDPGGGWKSYLLRDPILRDGENWIRFDKDGKKGVVIQDPIVRDNWLIWDTDPTGE